MAENNATSAVRCIREILNQASIADMEPFLTTLQSLSKQTWSEADVKQLEEELQQIYQSAVNQSDTKQVSILISGLHVLRAIIPPLSIITTWFELILRFALRNVKLEPGIRQKARELVLHGLSEGSKGVEFRRRIIDLYLLDVVRDSSGDDALEQATLDFEEQERKKCWKSNLEEILTDDVLRNPEGFFLQINEAFQSPPARLQIVVLLSQLARHPNLSISTLASSPMFSSLLMSLQVDNSTTVCSVEISTLIMLLPRLAIEAPRLLNEALPRLLVILKRVICWRVRPVGASKEPVTVGSLSDSGSNIQIDANSAFQLELLPDVKWTRLESSFDLTRSSPPDARLYFQFLYGLWPCNTLAFLRRPIKYLKDAGQEGPFADSWEEIIDEDEVHSRAKPILRSHILHPSIILRDSASELSDLSRWATDGLNVPGIFSECIILDVRNAAAAMPRSTAHAEFASSPIPGQLEDILGLKAGFPVQQLDSPSSSRAASKTRDETEAQIDQNWSSARDMAVPTVDLQYPMMDVVSSPPQLADDTPRDSRDLFTPRARGGNDSASPSIPPTPASPNLRASSPLTLPSPLPLTPSLEAHPSPRLHSRLLVSEALKHAKAREASEISAQAQEVISTLQREVLLLRNELNFELSLKHNHLTHMGKLHRDRVIARSEEAERQNLHNKLKHHKGALSQALEELKTVKAQATAAKFKQNEYISILSDRLAKYREEKQSWLNEAVELRGELNEAKLMVQKQKSILDDTETERFHLANQLRDVLPKVEQINDYEKKILSMTKIQIMWDDSPEMREYRQKKEEMDIMTSNYAKMELTLESLEAANRALEEEIAKQRRTIQSLQNNPSSSPTSSNNPSPTQSHFHYGSRMNRSMSVSVSQSQAQAMNVSHARLLTMETEHERVKRENIELEEKVEELEAMLEVLKMESASRAPGRRGSVHLSGFSLDPRDMRAGGLGMC